jgi:hypothetical protein
MRRPPSCATSALEWSHRWRKPGAGRPWYIRGRAYSRGVAVIELSGETRTVVAGERDAVVARVADLRRQSERLHAVVDQVDSDLQNAELLLRRMDEILGLAPQLAIDSLHEQLRGQRLREIAVEVLRAKRGVGAEIHYRDWFELDAEQGVRVGGKDPMATFLTQIGKAPQVETVRPRSGLYRLKSA